MEGLEDLEARRALEGHAQTGHEGTSIIQVNQVRFHCSGYATLRLTSSMGGGGDGDGSAGE